MVEGTCNDGIGGGNGGDDVLDHALGQRIRDSCDAELVASFKSNLEEPGNMLGVIVVEFFV